MRLTFDTKAGCCLFFRAGSCLSEDVSACTVTPMRRLWSRFSVVERVLMIGLVVSLAGTVAFLITGKRMLLLFVLLGGFCILFQFGYSIWGLLQYPLALRREAARERAREEPDGPRA